MILPNNPATESSEHAERVLWVNVILTAIRDATIGVGNNPHADRDRKIARRWFNVRSRDFKEVCFLAGMDPNRVAAQARAVIDGYDREGILPHIGAYGVKLHASAPTSAANDNAVDGKRPRLKGGRSCKLQTYNGKTATIGEWAAEYGIDEKVLTGRLRNGIPIERALTMQPGERKTERFTVDGVTLSIPEWAARLGITYNALIARLRKRSLAEAIAMQNGRHPDRGQGANFASSLGTGGGSTAQESAQMDFSGEAP